MKLVFSLIAVVVLSGCITRPNFIAHKAERFIDSVDSRIELSYAGWKANCSTNGHINPFYQIVPEHYRKSKGTLNYARYRVMLFEAHDITTDQLDITLNMAGAAAKELDDAIAFSKRTK
jgi:hypothetical protein